MAPRALTRVLLVSKILGLAGRLGWRRGNLPPRPETRLGRLVYNCAVLGRCGESITLNEFELREVEEVAGLRGFEQLLRCLMCSGNMECKGVRVSTRRGDDVEAPLYTCVCAGGEPYERQCGRRQILVEMHGRRVLLEISDVPL